jgi:hypothetical protein
MGIAEWFSEFYQNCIIPQTSISSFSYRYRRITKQLNTDFYSSSSETDNSWYVGSYGRDTASNLISDLDILYVLPNSLYQRYDQYAGNGQSALLQLVKASVQRTYPTSDSFADGQIVGIDFTDGVKVEIVPAFLNQSNTYTYPNTNGGGNWQSTDPGPEIKAINDINNETNKNLKKACRMMRHFVRANKVPMGGMLIDTLTARFLRKWEYQDKSFIYYDWLFRDLFFFLSEQDSSQTTFVSIGSERRMNRTGIFERKAKSAYDTAVEAIESAKNGYEYSAKSKWREIFGNAFPQ